MNKGIIIGVFVAIVVLASLFVFTKTGTTPTSSSPSSNTEESSLTPISPDNDVTNSAATIVVKDNGFSPSNVKVKVGDTVTVRNDSSNSVQFSSDPHPVHSDNQELNKRTIKPGESQTIKVTTKGTFGFHDHLDSSLTGELVVE